MRNTPENMANYVDHEYPDIDCDANPWPVVTAKKTVTVSRNDFDALVAAAEAYRTSQAAAMWLWLCIGAAGGGAVAGIMHAVWIYLCGGPK